MRVLYRLNISLKQWLWGRAQLTAGLTELRAKNKDQFKYDKKWVKVITYITLSFVVYRIFALTTPPQSIVKDIANNSQYRTIRKGTLFTSTKETPPFEEFDKKSVSAITFPDAGRAMLEKLLTQYKTVWYEIPVSIPRSEFQKDTFAVLLPKIWGRSALFVNDVEIDFGRNRWPIFALNQPDSQIFIRLSLDNSPKIGVTATYPPIWGPRSLLDEVPKRVEEESHLYPSAETIHLLIGGVFCLIFAFTGWKPEVFAFILYTAASYGYGVISKADWDNNLWFTYPALQKVVVDLFAMGRSLFLLLFVLEFVRKEKNEIINWLVFSSSVIGIGSYITAIVKVMIFGGDVHNAFQPAQESCFIVCSIFAFADTANLLVREQRSNRAWRLTWFALISCAIVTSQILILRDYISSQTQITSEYIQNLPAFIVAAAVVIAELTRNEKERDRIALSLSRETQEQLKKGYKDEDQIHQGFIVLVDGIDWTRRSEMCKTEAEYRAFKAGVDRHMIASLTTDETSLLNGTGDGFYVAFRLELTKANFDRVISTLKKFLVRKLRLNDIGCIGPLAQEEISFRAAVVYGSYSTGIVGVGSLWKEQASSLLCAPLNRICSGDQPNIRFLSLGENDQILKFLNCSKLSKHQIVDKRGVMRQFFEQPIQQCEDGTQKAG